MKLILKVHPKAFAPGFSMISWVMQYLLLLQWILQSSPQNADKYENLGQRYLQTNLKQMETNWEFDYQTCLCLYGVRTCSVLENGALMICSC